MAVLVVRIPDGQKEVPFTAGMTAGDAIDEAGFELKANEELRINGGVQNGRETAIRDGDAVIVVKDISGN